MFETKRTAAQRVHVEALDFEQPIGEGFDDSLEWLRTETSEDAYRLDTWDTHRLGNRGLPLIAYRLAVKVEDEDDDWDIIFTGDDFEPGMGTMIDDDQALADILGFLSLKPGDTEDDYFKHHAPWQLAWVGTYGDDLSLWSNELEGVEE